MSDRSRLEAVSSAITDRLASLSDQLVFGDPRVDTALLEAEGIRYLTRLAAIGALLTIEDYDPAYPQWAKMASPWLNWAFMNPDASYLYAPLHGDHTYRIFGTRGSARLFDVEVFEGGMARMDQVHQFAGRRDFEFGPAGEFEIILSRTRHEGNWVPLGEGPGLVCVRQYFYDWEAEDPAVLYIERQGATYPPTAPSADVISARLDAFASFLTVSPMMWAKGVELQHYSVEPNAVRFSPIQLGQATRDYGDQYAFRDIRMGQGRYACQPGKAIILEVTPPSCQYWCVHLMDHYWQTLDWMNRQTSINGHQAQLDPDGVFRAVISHTDPGVPNWLDPTGHEHGLIMVRYFQPDDTPVPVLRPIPLDELPKHLPDATPQVTPAERSEALRRRMHSVRRRMCDF